MGNSAESIVSSALKPLVLNADGSFRCYPDVAPEGAVKPYIVYQAAGGQSTNYLDDTDNLQNARMQVTVWATSRSAARQLMQSVIDVLTPEPILATSIGSPVSVYENDTKLFGSRLDFSIWWNT